MLLEGQHSRGSSRLHLLSRHCPVFRVSCVLSIQEASNHNNKQAGRSSVTTFGHSLPVGTSEKRRGRGGGGGFTKYCRETPPRFILIASSQCWSKTVPIFAPLESPGWPFVIRWCHARKVVGRSSNSGTFYGGGKAFSSKDESSF